MRRPLESNQSAKLSNQLGFISRECIRLPTKWKDMTKDDFILALDKLEMHLEIENIDDEVVQALVEDLLKIKSRKARYSLKKEYFEKFSSVEEAKQNKPPKDNLTQKDWEDLCDYWAKPETEERCKKNAANRSNLNVFHNQGSKAFVTLRHEIEQKEGKECDRIQFFKHTHYNELKGWASAEAEAKYIQMVELMENSIEDGIDMRPDEICDQVLGTRSGYIKGLGYGPKPKKRESNSSSSQKIKILRKITMNF